MSDTLSKINQIKILSDNVVNKKLERDLTFLSGVRGRGC